MIPVNYDSALWRAVERLYSIPLPPPQKRTKPMEVLCVGFPRSGTESLQQALLTLGYDYTYHGWDIVFDIPTSAPGWVRLAQKKYHGPSPDGDDGPRVTREDFDELIGHCVAVTDAAASCFAPEMIAAYPEAKVVLNVRRDLDAWRRSARGTLVKANRSWAFYLASWFDRECFWAWTVYERYLWPLLFRAPGGDFGGAIDRNGKWIYKEHSAMIKGLVPADRLLEWSVDEGWGPLCEFLGKDVPKEAFPHANSAGGGWKAREEQCVDTWITRAFFNMLLVLVALAVGGLALARYLR
ncbi:uncharacterized protein DNG_03744 [Cephalotrichum gorgonifer]|uniref:P-loop containing nucleoside triphosphate hydrolase protein n=1 Tax=Cephalotrichum gorgonifer TaxID=2041049 RepID=A0AAE8MVC9_9PEZI|nr:uncharacterized protein DNG_03744 [Cephalotrichum gorgonifer]